LYVIIDAPDPAKINRWVVHVSETFYDEKHSYSHRTKTKEEAIELARQAIVDFKEKETDREKKIAETKDALNELQKKYNDMVNEEIAMCRKRLDMSQQMETLKEGLPGRHKTAADLLAPTRFCRKCAKYESECVCPGSQSKYMLKRQRHCKRVLNK